MNLAYLRVMHGLHIHLFIFSSPDSRRHEVRVVADAGIACHVCLACVHRKIPVYISVYAHVNIYIERRFFFLSIGMCPPWELVLYANCVLPKQLACFGRHYEC